MQLNVPPIAHLGILRLSACADIVMPEDNPLIARLDQGDDVEWDAKYSESEWIHVRAGVWRSNEKCRAHLHVDLAVSDYFQADHEPTGTLDNIQDAMGQFERLHLNVDCDCSFIIPKSDLPKSGMVASILGVSTKSMGATLDLIGARMLVRGAPFQEIDWRLVGDEGDKIRSFVRFEKSLDLDEDYLATLVNHARSGLDRFILERRKSHGKTTTDGT